jgi:inosose dehydratase
MSNPQMILGIHPTCWTNDDFPEIGNSVPYQVILDQTKRAGFSGGSTGHNYPQHLPSLLKAMEHFGLRIAAIWAGTSFSTGIGIDEAFAEFQDGVAYLKQVGAKDVVVAELAAAVNQVRSKSVLTDRPRMNNAQWYLLTTLLNRAGKFAHDNGMQLSYHPHVGTVVQTMDETCRLLDSTEETVGLCLDTGHLRYAGASQDEIVDLVKRYIKRITHVHLKNVRSKVLALAVGNQFSFYQAIQAGIFTVPGDPEGDLDLAPILQMLKGIGYSGWMIIEAEQNPAKAEPLRYAQMARAYLKQQLGY